MRLSDFQKTSQGDYFIDGFYNFPFPNRLKIEMDENTSSVVFANFVDFYKHRSKIEGSLKKCIVQVYREKHNEIDRFSDDEIYKFTEKVYLDYDAGETLAIHVHLPWLNERVMKLEIDSLGRIQKF